VRTCSVHLKKLSSIRDSADELKLPNSRHERWLRKICEVITFWFSFPVTPRSSELHTALSSSFHDFSINKPDKDFYKHAWSVRSIPRASLHRQCFIYTASRMLIWRKKEKWYLVILCHPNTIWGSGACYRLIIPVF